MKFKFNLEFQSLFYWITYSYSTQVVDFLSKKVSFNPYFTGLPILMNQKEQQKDRNNKFQSLFYWITYSYTRGATLP